MGCSSKNRRPLYISHILADRVSTYKQLKGGVIFLDVIPKSPSGKILRRELRAQTQRAKL